ncbi:unnamed protein product, partial [marine sediment metagenome]
IKMQTATFSNLRGRRDSGEVRPIVTAKEKTTNFTRPAVIQKNGGTKASEPAYLVTTSIAMSSKDKK